MSTTPATTLTCTQCGGELHPDEGQIFITCPYCSATVYIDKSRVVFHWSLAPTLDAAQAAAALRRWMSGNQTVKDLDQKARVISQAFQYFPLWYFRYGGNGAPAGAPPPGAAAKAPAHATPELAAIEPAAATSVTELRKLNLPAGDLQHYDPALDAQSEPPTVPLEAAMEWLSANRQVSSAVVRETSLVHIPVYYFKYIYKNQPYTAVVEAATGSVLANIYPAKAEAPYLLAGGVAALVYLCLAASVLVTWSSVSDSSHTLVAAIFAGLACLAAPFLFGLAVWVASRV
jgi:hypothetical protein